jgi:hypothetical protein
MITTKFHNPRALLVWRIEQWLAKCAAKGRKVDVVVIHPKDKDEAWTVRAQFPNLTIKILGEDSYSIPK